MQYEAANWQVIGHGWAVEQLTLAMNLGRMRHAYLFTGTPSIGKTTLARALAMAVNCLAESGRPCGQCRPCTLIAKDGHPDVVVVEAERVGGTLKIEQVRELQHVLALRPYEGRYRVAILRRFHEAHVAAANALLKTLEEPPPNVILILTADDAHLLLPTIVSRCQQLPLKPLRLHEVQDALERYWQVSKDDARLLAHLSGGRIGWAIRVLQDDQLFAERQAQIDLLEGLLGRNRAGRFAEVEGLTKDKSTLLELLQVWLTYWRDALLLAQGNDAWLTNIDREEQLRGLVKALPVGAFQKALRATRRTLDYLGRNVNSRLALETMLLDYPYTKGKLI